MIYFFSFYRQTKQCYYLQCMLMMSILLKKWSQSVKN